VDPLAGARGDTVNSKASEEGFLLGVSEPLYFFMTREILVIEGEKGKCHPNAIRRALS